MRTSTTEEEDAHTRTPQASQKECNPFACAEFGDIQCIVLALTLIHAIRHVLNDNLGNFLHDCRCD